MEKCIWDGGEFYNGVTTLYLPDSIKSYHAGDDYYALRKICFGKNFRQNPWNTGGPMTTAYFRGTSSEFFEIYQDHPEIWFQQHNINCLGDEKTIVSEWDSEARKFKPVVDERYVWGPEANAYWSEYLRDL